MKKKRKVSIFQVPQDGVVLWKCMASEVDGLVWCGMGRTATEALGSWVDGNRDKLLKAFEIKVYERNEPLD